MAAADCAELREDGSCIHSDHMAEVDAVKYRSIRTPAAARDALGEFTTQDDLLAFATDGTQFDGDIADLF